MLRDRFHNIMCVLYFSKKPKTEQSKLSDPLYKIQPLFDHFNSITNAKNLLFSNKFKFT